MAGGVASKPGVPVVAGRDALLRVFVTTDVDPIAYRATGSRDGNDNAN